MVVNDLLEILDKYKFGILAALASYIIIFMYLQMDSYTVYTPIEIFHEGSHVEVPEEDIHLKPENIDMSGQFQSSDVKNATRDMNDTRQRSNTDYSYNSAAEAEAAAKSVEDLEKQYREESGGYKEREKYRQMIQENQTSQTEEKGPEKVNNGGANNAAGGEVMVDWQLNGRTPHENNEWHVRNPGYTCGFAQGKVAVLIKVDQSGRVISASVDNSRSTKATACMLEQALNYAKKSRFNYLGSAPKSQQGYIYYTFVAQ
ncbi:MAG: hypothetical protein ACO2Z9_00410 [Crocinitomicaceae bacterium]